jgi:3-dehydroquinate dehydratase/shikimate dehydrogenase
MKSKVRICVPVCVSRVDELVSAVRRAAEVGDVIELRLDCLEPQQLTDAIKRYGELRAAAARPFILTLRPSHQAGRGSFDLNARVNFWRQFLESWRDQSARADLVDIEAELLIGHSPLTEDLSNQQHQRDVICSHHDFDGVPDDLDRLYERMTAASAGVIKIAVQAGDATDCIPIFKLLERSEREGRQLIGIAMGQAGVMTRILGPSRGSYLTYGALDDDSATAPGQLTARELREVYRIDEIDRQTEIMGLIGQPVAHSISPQIHNAAFATARLNAVYIPFEVHDANQFMRRMVQPRSREIDWRLRGLSVTAPHKLIVMDRLDWVEPSAKEIQAVNTIVIKGGELHGYNTDAIGFVRPLRQKFGSLKNARCAVIGAGGAARAALWALRNEGAHVVLFARDPAFAEHCARRFGAECRSLQNARFNDFDVVINATPSGTRGKAEPETPATSAQLRGVRLAYDLVYNPLETQFMREARAAGCEVLGGLEMLIAQAVEQFKLWTETDPDVGAMRAAAEKALQA